MTRNLRRLGALTGLVVGAWFAFPGELRAQESARSEAQMNEARGLYDAGAVAFSDGRFEDALSRWQEAYALSDLSAFLYNIGTAYDRLGRSAEALEHYRAYVAALPEAENLNYVMRRMTVLETQIPSANENAENEDETESVDGGETADGGASSQHGSSRVSVPAIAMVAGGGALLVAGLATGLAANGRYTTLEDGCVQGRCQAAQQGDIDGLKRLALSTDILLSVGVVATLAGVLWLIIGGGSDNEDGQTVRVDLGPRGVAVSGRF